MSPSDRDRWVGEFRTKGENEVRSAMVTGRWSREKRAVAREWLERRDIENWAKTAKGAPGLASIRKRFKAGNVAIVVGLLFGLIAVARVLKQF